MTFTISQTYVCLMANLVLLNLTLFLTVHFHAVHGYAATHMHITHVLCFSSILPLPCGCIILLISIHACPKQVSVDSIPTCIYRMIVYKGQGINWHLQSDSLGVSPLKWTHSAHPIISGLRHLVESLRQLICFIGCFIRIRLQHLPYPFHPNHPCSHTSQCIAPFL